MGILHLLIGGGIAGGILISKKRKKIIAERKQREEARRQRVAEEQRRLNTPCFFEDKITEEDFNRIIKKVGKEIRRIASISANGAIVRVVYRSQSGITDYSFSVDFNDYGHVTGRYWLNDNDSDSNIPQVTAERISELITDHIEAFEEQEERNKSAYQENSSTANAPKYCPHCGKKVELTGSSFCGYCGRAL